MSASQKPFNFGLLLHAPHTIGTTSGSPRRNPFAIDQIASYARDIENSGFTLLVLDDELDSSAVKSGAKNGLENFTQAAYIACKTRTLGVAVSANTNYVEPFSLARLLASLDYVSHGRAAWLVTDSESGNAAANHQRAATNAASRHARREESLAVVNRLFDTWEDDAFIRDKASGEFVDVDKVHFLEHRGAHFSVKGPLNVARPPQGHVPRIHFLTPQNAHARGALAYDLLIASAIADSDIAALHASGLIWKLLVPFIADDIAVGRQQLIAHVDAIALDDDLHGHRWVSTSAENETPLAPVGQRNLAALGHVLGENLSNRDSQELVDADVLQRLNSYGKSLLAIALERFRYSGINRDATALRWLDLLRAHADRREVFVGTPADWECALQALSAASSPYSGVLLAPAALHYLDASFAARLLPAAFRSTHNHDNRESRARHPQLRDALNLPRPPNSFVVSTKSA